MEVNNHTQESVDYGKVLADFLGEEDARPVSEPQAGVPTFTDGQIRQAFMVIPSGYCNINC